jgi:cyclopropane fatty-acyl-phospholipid synthase-like methyltransferase
MQTHCISLIGSPVLKSHSLPLVPGLDERLEDGIRVLDVGCGRNRALNLLAAWFPNSRFVGIDLSEEAIEFACVEAEERGNKNASFIARDLSQFDQQAQPSTFDFITTFDAVHDQASPRNAHELAHDIQNYYYVCRP